MLQLQYTAAAMDQKVFFCFLGFLHFVASEPLPPFDLKCEQNFVGLSSVQLRELSKQPLFATDAPNPRLSWTLAHTGRAAYQTAFQVSVAEDRDIHAVIWDSGVIEGQETSIR